MPDAGELPESLAVEVEAASDAVADAGAASLLLAAGLEAPPEPPRKSVTYQPLPFSWKPAAVNCFLNEDWLQDGHSVRGASDIFCSTSLAKPQASQR
ncbi:MAG: hypothetical protein V7642_1152 [Burkholderiales bacterium]